MKLTSSAIGLCGPPDHRTAARSLARTRLGPQLYAGSLASAELPMDFQPTSYFAGLPVEEQERVRLVGREMVLYAWRHAAGIITAPPPSKGGAMNSASGCLLRLGAITFLVTAAHVLKKFEERVAADPSVVMQVADLVIDPRGRVAWRDDMKDVVLLRLSEEEVSQVGVAVALTPMGWPPPEPQPGDYVIVSGYPGVLQERPNAKRVDFRALSSMFEVTTAGSYHLVSQWTREDFVGFDAAGVPAPGTELGGMSGGPVFLVRNLAYPLIGIITDFHTDWELMRIAVLGAVTL